MPIYFIRSKLKTQFRLVELKRLQLGSGLVELSFGGDVRSFFLYDLTESKGTLVRPAGIGVDMHLSAADIQTAMKYAKYVANEFISVSSFAMQTESGAAEFVMAYDATPGVELREFIVTWPLAVGMVTRLFDPHIVQQVFAALGSLQRAAESSSAAQKRLRAINLAMKWLGKGFGDDGIDEVWPTG